MRVLLIHPEDELLGEPWGSGRWDRVFDLGRAGAGSYSRASAGFGCQVTGLDEFRENFKEMRRVAELLSLGRERLKDSFGLDWWELTAILVHEQLEIAFVLQQLADQIGPAAEVHISRPGFHADVLRLALGPRSHVFPRKNSLQARAVRYLGLLKKFPVSQLLEFFWDKTDSGYQFRGSFNSKRKVLSDAVVLLPSAYVNVSRTGMAFAKSLPEARFLLVVTRRSGWLQNPPANVTTTWLRRYASVRAPSRELEYQDLLKRWEVLRRELEAVPEFQMLAKTGRFADFPKRFACGLEIRDAWRNVLDSEPVQAVICGDDTNPYTHIPLLLAKYRGLPAIACHHGALDGRYLFKRNHADVLLAKGRMEADYLVRVCGISPDGVEIGAPAVTREVKQWSVSDERPFIAYFSEPYEIAGGRGRDFYQDILPRLADLALAERRELMIKLHPSESLAERRRFVEQVLTPEQLRVTRVVDGPLESELLDRAWFGITVMSTVVVECSLRGIPCFLCTWLEAWPYGYDDQFARFEVGIRLNQPEEIPAIPAILRTRRANNRARESCWSPIDAKRLRTLLGFDQAKLPRPVKATNQS